MRITYMRRLSLDGDGNDDLERHAGHPKVGNACNLFSTHLNNWVNIDNFSACSANETTGNYWRGINDWNHFHFMPLRYASTTDNCYLTFREATSSGDDGFSRGTPLTSSRVTVELSGCEN